MMTRNINYDLKKTQSNFCFHIIALTLDTMQTPATNKLSAFLTIAIQSCAGIYANTNYIALKSFSNTSRSEEEKLTFLVVG